MKDQDIPSVNSKQVLGIEVEVENYTTTDKSVSQVWTRKEDGSLRNDGVEWVSAPLLASDIPAALFNLLGQYLDKDQCCFSPRTSIHVHANMQEWEPEQVAVLVSWYTVFEKLLYRFTGRGRANNIYCVPLMENPSTLRYLLTQEFIAAADRWTKYTGLNLLPLRNLGTVEFRHMHGTFDIKKVVTWIRLLCRLLDFVESHTLDWHLKALSDLDSSTDFPILLYDVFGEDVAHVKFKEDGDLIDNIF
jgi:hypothetical protein